MSALDEIAAERRRQIEQEAWSPEHDDDHDAGQLAAAAGCYALDFTCADVDSRFPRRTLPDGVPRAWPWANAWWKPTSYRRNLIKAGALIVAELERLDRKASREGAER